MDRIPTLQMAIQNEEAEKAYYLSLAALTTNPLSKQVFQALAEDEEEHKQRLTRIHAKLVSEGTWPQDVPIEVHGMDIRRALEEIMREHASDTRPDTDVLEALRKGIEFESSRAGYYEKIAAACNNPEDARFFSFMAAMEREHMLSIQDSLFYLEDPQGWMKSKERVSMDGA